jgi:NADH-quinone oxidoreductase subunit L
LNYRDQFIHDFVIFAPLIGFLLVGLLGNRLGDRISQFFTCGLVGIAALLSWVLFGEHLLTGEKTIILPLFTWIKVGALSADWELRFDTLSLLMISVVNTISALVHIYSVGYMAHDDSKPRFMAYLSLFTFMMLALVTANNLVQLFFGWEGVGLTSYLLIGFWYKRDSANAAAIKAFVVNRIGDLGLVLGLVLIFAATGSLNFDNIFGQLGALQTENYRIFGYNVPLLELAGILLFIGAMGKSAQLGLHTWLPDAMEGPTPVSALIHAATMVTAGVFLVCRMSPMYELAPIARAVIMFIGASTAFFAGTVALAQNDIKRVIAYSTCSQLGYMFFAAGASAYTAAMFHLTTHAFFKALLFLGSGAVIHAMSDEQDMRQMGGIYKKIPYTYALMWIGSLALAGMPWFAGYYSKDMIISATWLVDTNIGRYAYFMGVIGAFLTALYSWRLLMMTFHGPAKANEKVMAHIHEAPLSMGIPMAILAVGATFGGWFPELYGWFSTMAPNFWKGSISVPVPYDAIEAVPSSVALTVKALGVGGILLAVILYGPLREYPAYLAKRLSIIYRFLLNKWYFDELYDTLFVKPSFDIGKTFWHRGDQLIIDGYGPDGISSLSMRIAVRVSRLQSGYVYHYVFAMGFGVAILILSLILLR